MIIFLTKIQSRRKPISGGAQVANGQKWNRFSSSVFFFRFCRTVWIQNAQFPHIDTRTCHRPSWRCIHPVRTCTRNAVHYILDSYAASIIIIKIIITMYVNGNARTPISVSTSYRGPVHVSGPNNDLTIIRNDFWFSYHTRNQHAAGQT